MTWGREDGALDEFALDEFALDEFALDGLALDGLALGAITYRPFTPGTLGTAVTRLVGAGRGWRLCGDLGR
jgi:hypothetical protein